MRPFRNPSNREEYAANHGWRVQQLRLHPDERDPEWRYSSAFRVDDGLLLEGYVEDLLVDPFAVRGFARPRARPDREADMAHNAGMVKRHPQLNLDKLPAGPEIPRDIKLPPFKIDYDSHEQINQKLNGTVILIKNRPFIVSETAEIKKGIFALLVYDNEREQKYVMYEDVADCRGIAPGYFTYRGTAYWTYRVPERQNSQGMHQRNMQCKPAGNPGSTSARTDFLLNALNLAQDVKYAPNLHDLILGGVNQSIRLTNRIALHKTNKKGAPIGVEYCGRQLGLIVNEQCKVFDESDLTPSWIHKDVSQAGLVLTA